MCENVYTLMHIMEVLQFGCAEPTIGFDFQFNCLNIVPCSHIPTNCFIGVFHIPIGTWYISSSASRLKRTCSLSNLPQVRMWYKNLALVRLRPLNTASKLYLSWRIFKKPRGIIGPIKHQLEIEPTWIKLSYQIKRSCTLSLSNLCSVVAIFIWHVCRYIKSLKSGSPYLSCRQSSQTIRASKLMNLPKPLQASDCLSSDAMQERDVVETTTCFMTVSNWLGTWNAISTLVKYSCNCIV